jgi:hypothetical protein
MSWSLAEELRERSSLADFARNEEVERNIIEVVQTCEGYFDSRSLTKTHYRGGKAAGLYVLSHGKGEVAGVGFSLCSPQDRYDEEEATVIAAQRADLWREFLGYRIASCDEAATLEASLAEGVALIPKHAAKPLHRFLTHAYELVGRPSWSEDGEFIMGLILPGWARKFMKDMWKLEKASRSETVSIAARELMRCRRVAAQVKQERKAAAKVRRAGQKAKEAVG